MAKKAIEVGGCNTDRTTINSELASPLGDDFYYKVATQRADERVIAIMGYDDDSTHYAQTLGSWERTMSYGIYVAFDKYGKVIGSIADPEEFYDQPKAKAIIYTILASANMRAAERGGGVRLLSLQEYRTQFIDKTNSQ